MERAELERMQQALREQVLQEDVIDWSLSGTAGAAPALRLVGGMDVSFWTRPSAVAHANASSSTGPGGQQQHRRAELQQVVSKSGMVPPSAQAQQQVEGRGERTEGARQRFSQQQQEEKGEEEEGVQGLEEGVQGLEEHAVAGLVVLSLPGMAVEYEDYEHSPAHGGLPPYAPGLLAQREAGLYLQLLKRAAATRFLPQVLLVDGSGLLHPRRCGLACQLGVLADLPCIGVAKNLLALGALCRHAVRAEMDRVMDGVAAAGGASRKGQRRMQQQAVAGGPAGSSSTIASSASETVANDRTPSVSCASCPLASPPLPSAAAALVAAAAGEGPSAGAASAPGRVAAAVPDRGGALASGCGSAGWTSRLGPSGRGAAPSATIDGRGFAVLPLYADPDAEAGIPSAHGGAAGCGAGGLCTPAFGSAAHDPPPPQRRPQQAEQQQQQQPGAVAAAASGPSSLAGPTRELLGAAVCVPGTRRPLYVSVGHRLSLATAVEVVRRCCVHRVPEPIRQADIRTRNIARELQASQWASTRALQC